VRLIYPNPADRPALFLHAPTTTHAGSDEEEDKVISPSIQWHVVNPSNVRGVLQTTYQRLLFPNIPTNTRANKGKLSIRLIPS
jgi:hypothetical protein